jgi:error-prone DNA polymerase
MCYTELQVTTNFSFLRGGSHPEEMINQALQLGYPEIAITDHNTLAGIVRAYIAARGKQIRIIPACRLNLTDGHSLLAYPTTKQAYAQLSGLLSAGNLRAEKGECLIYKSDVYQYARGIIFIMVPPASLNTDYDFDSGFINDLKEYRLKFGEALYLGATRSYQAGDGWHNWRNRTIYRWQPLMMFITMPRNAGSCRTY